MGIAAALEALSTTGGGLKTCDPSAWRVFLAAEEENRGALDSEFVDEAERAQCRNNYKRESFIAVPSSQGSPL